VNDIYQQLSNNFQWVAYDFEDYRQDCGLTKLIVNQKADATLLQSNDF